jgi:peptidoglycan/LPS O-acetylase OafA/YrhL
MRLSNPVLGSSAHAFGQFRIASEMIATYNSRMGANSAISNLLGKFRFNGPTIAERATMIGGRASGFDYLRLVLASMILALHSFSQQSPIPEFDKFLFAGKGRFLHDSLVPMFFALSGYLVAGSLDRAKSLAHFLGLRVLRIFPALWVDVLFSAFVLGTLLTTFSLPDYFRAPELYAYLMNLVGDVHYTLPGMFPSNPNRSVNIQLWTIPYELWCYILISIIAALGFYRRRKFVLVITIAAQILYPAAVGILHMLYKMPAHPFQVAVVPSFLAGVTVHCYRDRIVLNDRIFLIVLAASVGALVLGSTLIFLLPFGFSYLVVYLGLNNPRKLWIIRSGDYSYGLFLYHRPIQQALWLLVPFARVWYGSLLLSSVTAFLFAVLSWHFVEKHALNQRKRFHASAHAISQ